VGWLAICNAVLAVLMPWYLVTRLGVGVETDAYFASSILPQLAFYIVGTALLQVLVPLLAPEDEETLRRDAWAFFLVLAGIFGSIAVLLFVTAPYWAPLLVPGFSPRGVELMISMTRIQLVSMVFIILVMTLGALYQARQKFIWFEVSLIMANAIALFFLVSMLPRFGIMSAAWAGVLNNGLRLAFLFPVLGRWRRPDWKTPQLKEAWRRMKPFLVALTYTRSDPLVDRLLSSMASAGGLSLLTIAQQCFSQINLIINKAISAPTLPLLALEAKAENWDRFRRVYRHRLTTVAGVTLSGCVTLLLFGQPLLRFTIGHGGITSSNVRTLWLVMIALLGMLTAGAASQITSVSFYAMGNTRTPARLLLWTYSIYIPIKVFVFLHYGLIGLAVVISAHLLANFLLQFVLLERTTSRALTFRRSSLPDLPASGEIV